MALDLRTIYVVASLTLIVLGAIQLVAYATGRFKRWPLWWSASNILTGIGCLCIAFRDIVSDAITIDLGNAIILAGYLLMFVAIREFAGRKLDPSCYILATAVGSLVIIVFLGGTADTMGRIAFGSMISCLVDLAVIREGWSLARREKLYSAWIFVTLYVPTAAIFATRSALALTDNLSGPELFRHGGQNPHAWLALSSVTFLMLRNMVMLMMASERSYCELAALALRDPLTGLLNRVGLSRSFKSLDNRPSALIFDMDHFKALNDRHGHAAGDDALRLFSGTAATALRAGDLLCRLGGDEFVAILDGATIEEAVLMAGRIQQAFANAIALRADLSVHPTLSIGVARAGSAKTTLEVLLQKADTALYRSKREGRNKVAVTVSLSSAASVS